MRGLLGQGAVAIWHDIAAEGRDEFYAWHGQEHMHERVAIPGFLRGRRYIGVGARLEFFNLYETTDAQVPQGKDYAERLNNPPPWTVSAVKHFRAVSRSICEVAYSFGFAQGGLMATLRYDVAKGHADAHLAALRARFFPLLAAAPGIAGVHLLVADDEASGVVNAEQRARGTANAVPRWVLMVEGWGDETPFMASVRGACGNSAMEALGAAGPFNLDLYRHQITVGKTS